MRVVTLPAHVAASVVGHVDFQGVRGFLRVSGVATPTEFSGHGLAGTVFPRAHFVLVGSVMATCARDVYVTGHSFGSRDRRVACFTFLWRLRRYGVVGIVACYARFHGIMRRRQDLREARRSRREVLVTQRTVSSLPRGPKFDRLGIIHVVRRGPVTNLAGEASVIAPRFRFHHVVMTIDANVVAGVEFAQGCDFVQRRSPVMPELSEIAGDQHPPDRKEYRDQHDQKHGKPLDLFGKPIPPSGNSTQGCATTHPAHSKPDRESLEPLSKTHDVRPSTIVFGYHAPRPCSSPTLASRPLVQPRIAASSALFGKSESNLLDCAVV